MDAVLSDDSKSQKHYRSVLYSLKFFFNLRIFLLIIASFLIIFFTNDLINLKESYDQVPVLSNTQHHIKQYFMQAESQINFISQTIQKIVQIQFQTYKKTGYLYYQKKQPLTNVKKIIFEDQYSTNGEYMCLNGNCTAIQFYLVNLWAKRNYFGSLNVIYFKYYDPIQNSINIAYTPRDLNKLSTSQIKHILSNQNLNNSLQKIGENVYLKNKAVYNFSFEETYEINFAIQLRKESIEQILKKDIQLNSFYNCKVKDSIEWVNFKCQTSQPRFSYIIGQSKTEISYFSRQTNKKLITFQFKIPQIKLIFEYFKFSILFPVLFLVFQFFRQTTIYRAALQKFFSKTQKLISLYEFNIQQIFTGKKPKPTIILNDTTSSQFYQELSQIPSGQYEPVLQSSKVKIAPKLFSFSQITKKIVEKYNQHAKQIFRQKNKQIISNKFFIHSSVNQISESQNLKIKEALAKAQELGLVKTFFKFAYLALLLNPNEFDGLIQKDNAPLPDQYIKMMRQINRTVNSTQVRKAFRLSSQIRKQTEEELEMRIQINLLQKYLQILKDLDVHNLYAKQLELQRDLQNVNNYIQNIKHVFNKHNKNIRTLGK